MSRKTFSTIVAFIAMAIGSIGLFFPDTFLKSKGIINNPAATIWMSEVGVLLIATGIILFLIRAEEACKSLKAVFIGNIVIQIGLLIIELNAFSKSIITEINGILPNCALHVILTGSFLYYTFQTDKELRKKNREEHSP